MFGSLLYLILLLSPINSFNSSNSNEINGSFAYETDIKKNELYIINSQLEFNTYSLDNGVLKSSIQITTNKSETLENKTWGGLYDSFKLTPTVLNGLLRDLTLKKINGRFFLFHDGGGLIIEILGENLVRKDNSFPFMNKFFGDFRSFEIDLRG